MKTKHKVIALSLITAAGLAHGIYTASQPKVTSINHVGPDYLYPNPVYTLGKADTLNLSDLTRSYNGQTYSQSHRNVQGSEKDSVCKEYSVNCQAPKEIDHFYPLCAGGSNDITNLWAQPETNVWNGQDFGFHTKDKLEAWICVQIKAGKLDPKVAYQEMTNDWVAYYLKVAPNLPLGSMDPSADPIE